MLTSSEAQRIELSNIVQLATTSTGRLSAVAFHETL